MERKQFIQRIFDQLEVANVVALLGPRQSGKTTLARQFAASGAESFNEALNYFDLENPAHLERLSTPKLALERLAGLVVLDEIQHRPDLIPILRVLADREKNSAKFLVLGGASRDLIRQGAEKRRPTIGAYTTRPSWTCSSFGTANGSASRSNTPTRPRRPLPSEPPSSI